MAVAAAGDVSLAAKVQAQRTARDAQTGASVDHVTAIEGRVLYDLIVINLSLSAYRRAAETVFIADIYRRREAPAAAVLRMKCDTHIGNTAGVIFTDAVDVERQLAAAFAESVHPQVGQAGPDGVLNAGKIERTDVAEAQRAANQLAMGIAGGRTQPAIQPARTAIIDPACVKIGGGKEAMI